MSRVVKKMMLEEVKKDLSGVDGAVMLGLKGLDVAESQSLRKAFREKKIKVRLLKNSLARVAFKELGVADLEKFLDGPTAIAFTRGDALAPSKAVDEWAKKSKKIEIRGGLVDGRVISAAEVKTLSKVPGRPDQLAMLCGLLQSPLRSLAQLITSPVTEFARLVTSLKEKNEKDGAAAPAGGE